MENSFKNLIDSAKEILVVLPTKPYTDQVASALALYLSLSAAEKKVSVYSENQMTAEFSRLVGVDKVMHTLGSKDLNIKFVNYNPDNIDKVSYDVDGEHFKLTVSPKSGFNAPTKEQIEVDHSGFSADLIMLVGGAVESHFSVLKNEGVQKARIVHVGTRLLEVESEIEVLSFAHPASSTSEIIAMLIKEGGYPVDGDIATNLISGIEEQSKGFQSQDVTADTFMIFSELLRLGGKRINRMVTQNYPQGSIPAKPYNQKVVQENTLINQIEEEIPLPDEVPHDIPSAWSEPKIFTGTSVS